MGGEGCEKGREKTGSFYSMNVRVFADFPPVFWELTKGKKPDGPPFPHPSQPAPTPTHPLGRGAPAAPPTPLRGHSLVLCSTGQFCPSSPPQPCITAVSSHPGCRL